MEKRVLCIECGSKDDYEFREMIREYEGEAYHFEMLVNVPFCRQCGAPVYIEDVECEIAEKANRKIRNKGILRNKI